MHKFLFVQILFVLLFSFSANAQQAIKVKLMPAPAFLQSLDSFTQKQVIDVRTPEEFQSGHLAAAKNINIYDADFIERIGKLDRAKPVFVYCKGGGRSANAAKTLHEMGFTSIYDLQGGIMSWENKQLPITFEETSNPESNSFTLSDYDSLLAKNNILLVDFYAFWCIPCKKMEPSLKKLSKEYKGKVTISRIDIDKAKPLAKHLAIESIPLIAVYKNGKEIKRVSGFQSTGELRELVKYLLSANK